VRKKNSLVEGAPLGALSAFWGKASASQTARAVRTRIALDFAQATHSLRKDRLKVTILTLP